VDEIKNLRSVMGGTVDRLFQICCLCCFVCYSYCLVVNCVLCIVFL
jgi:hypothetical protein